jgi:mitochondrial intermediate peptidase
MELMLAFQIIALVCNFSNASGITARLSHGEVETLFHEFRHALHSLLSRTVMLIRL